MLQPLQTFLEITGLNRRNVFEVLSELQGKTVPARILERLGNGRIAIEVAGKRFDAASAGNIPESGQVYVRVEKKSASFRLQILTQEQSIERMMQSLIDFFRESERAWRRNDAFVEDRYTKDKNRQSETEKLERSPNDRQGKENAEDKNQKHEHPEDQPNRDRSKQRAAENTDQRSLKSQHNKDNSATFVGAKFDTSPDQEILPMRRKIDNFNVRFVAEENLFYASGSFETGPAAFLFRGHDVDFSLIDLYFFSPEIKLRALFETVILDNKILLQNMGFREMQVLQDIPSSLNIQA